MEKIPVNIISGFLGSGKTTAIIKLIDQKPPDEKWAVIINEFGKISIDSQTIRSSTQAGAVFDISGGCICCSAKGYFQENLEKIVQSGNFTRIIIEPSGLGGIEMVSEFVTTNYMLKLMPTICLVDITSIENSRLRLNPIYRMQISKADVIVFSKCDLVTDSTLPENLIIKFKSLFPDKEDGIYTTVSNLLSYLSRNDFAKNQERNSLRILLPANSNLTDRNYQQNNFIFTSDTIFNVDRLILFFKDHPQIVRAKGHIQTERGWNLLNFTLSGCIFEPCQIKKQNELILIFEKPEPYLLQNLKRKFEKNIM